MGFDHMAIPIIGKQYVRSKADLVRQMERDSGRDVLFLGGKASFVLKILEQDGEAKQVMIRFAVFHQIEFGGVKRKVRSSSSSIHCLS